jgi:hypothetical protein
MKKNLLFKTIIMLVLLAGLSTSSWAQILYEGFNYATPAFIGGNGDAGATSNNWVTHSVTAGETTTIDIENGSLSYTGLAASTGNKVFLFSNANKTSRDVNRAFTSTATTLYYSVLVNIIDNSQINTLDNYFMHFGATAGATNTTFGGRLGVKSVGTPATNFRFIIVNTSGGTPVYTDNGSDLNFGTTYLVVVKFNISVALTVATMWVNPTSLGGTEPTGGISNSTGTNAITTFASICLRNNATTPKAYIDEIRVGETWASVTPTGNVGINYKEQPVEQTSIFPNPAKSYFNVKAPEGKYFVTVNNSIGSVVKTANLTNNGKVETSDLRPGVYYVRIENTKTSQREIHKLIIR